MDDPSTAIVDPNALTATRYYTFGGSTVAMRNNDGSLSLMLGDEQGSTNVVMPVHVQASGALAPATLADAAAVTRTSYTPYGELRGTVDNTATDRGWLGQVEDRVDGATGTGLTYLNARYYDPATSRFISPDPLVNPGDPKTLDPYRYADNNPVVFTDATGLAACYGLSPDDEWACMTAYNRGTSYDGETGPGADSSDSPSSTPPPASGSKHSDSPSVGNYLWHGLVNGWGGMLNAASSTVNGLYAKGWGVKAYESITGKEVAWIPEIPSVGIWGDYDTYKGWSWYGSTVFFVASVVATRGASGAGVAVEEAGVATEAVEAAFAANRAADILATPKVASPKLQNIVNDLYKGTTSADRVGNGTTMDAIANELATGLPTKGKFHSIKGQDYLNGLNTWLERSPSAPYQDRLVAQSLADEVSKTLGGAG